MMIGKSEVEQIAKLARLRLEPSEVEAMANDLGSILDHIRELESIDVGGVSSMVGASEHPAPTRPDQLGADPLQLALREIAPTMQEGFFVVPRLAALDVDAQVEGSGH